MTAIKVNVKDNENILSLINLVNYDPIEIYHFILKTEIKAFRHKHICYFTENKVFSTLDRHILRKNDSLINYFFNKDLKFIRKNLQKSLRKLKYQGIVDDEVFKILSL